jgi:hypothetical protein
LQMVKIMHLEMAHHGTPEGKVELNWIKLCVYLS